MIISKKYMVGKKISSIFKENSVLRGNHPVDTVKPMLQRLSWERERGQTEGFLGFGLPPVPLDLGQ